ncbi:MAG: hypothetical protein ACK2U9_04255, partial [Anaerolineae bacterium]
MVRDVQHLEGAIGAGVVVQHRPGTTTASSLALVSSVIERSAGGGLLAHGTAIQLDRTVVRDTLTTSDPLSGRGLMV